MTEDKKLLMQRALALIECQFTGPTKRPVNDFSVKSIRNMIKESPFTKEQLKLKVKNGKYVSTGEIDTFALLRDSDYWGWARAFQLSILQGQNDFAKEVDTEE